MGKAFSIRFTVPPGNSAFVVPWDSTRGPEGISHASIAAGADLLAPGRKRGRFPRKLIIYTIKTTGQNVTVDEQVLTGVAGTSADWESSATGTFTVTAGTASPREFKTGGTDHRILVTAGATGPTTLVLEGDVVDHADFGG